MQLAEPATYVTTVRPPAIAVEGLNGSFSGRLAVPDRDAWTSAVVVVPDRSGINAHVLGACRDLALAGHAALAIDIPVSELDAPVVRSSASSSVLDRCTGAVDAALEFLETVGPARPNRFGVVGYGAGGVVALAAGYRCQVGAAVSFYGEGAMRLQENLKGIIERPKRHAATFLCLIGAADEDVRAPKIGELPRHFEAFGMRCNFIVYPRTKAGFCDPGDPRYRPLEARDAWGRLVQALESAARRRHRFTRNKTGPRTAVDVMDPAKTLARRGK
jgi:carboxymethylenebutenolidase